MASNYDPKAKINDGSCLYPITHLHPVLRAVLDAGLTESSGLVFTNDKLWTHNDSGDPADIYSIDSVTGKILQTVAIDNYLNTDWEDITADSAYIYIGDFGNNDGTRKDLKILRIKKADIGAKPAVHVNADAISFSYTDQKSFVQSSTHNFDCESVISIRDSLYIFTKDRGDLQTRVYKLPKLPGTYPVSPYTSFNAGGLITGADYDPVKKEVALIGYLKGHFNSFIWLLNDFRSDMFFSGNKRRVEIENGEEWQTEGICYRNTGRLYISCETAGSIKASLYTLDESSILKSGIRTEMQNAGIKCYPNPAEEILHISGDRVMRTVSIQSSLGQTIFLQHPGTNFYDIELLTLNCHTGMYTVNIETDAGMHRMKMMFSGK